MQHNVAVQLPYNGAHRNLKNAVLPLFPLSVAAFTVGTPPGFDVGMEAEVG